MNKLDIKIGVYDNNLSEKKVLCMNCCNNIYRLEKLYILCYFYITVLRDMYNISRN